MCATARCCPFSFFNPFNVSFAVAKEKVEDERKAIAFELEQAKRKIESDEIARIEYEFQLDERKEEIAKLKTRLESQSKKFDSDIQEICNVCHQLDETLKSREQRIKTLEEELSGLNPQAEIWFASAKSINDLLRSKFIHVPFLSRICLFSFALHFV